MDPLEEKFNNLHLLERGERIKLIKDLEVRKPAFLLNYVPSWWWWKRCEVNVLIVTDGGLNFGTGPFHLSEFLTTFNQLEDTSWINYKVTLAHRGTIINSTNPVVVNHISNFKFDTSADLSKFDQMWLFGISSGGSITTAEVDAIDKFMDGGGGLFATGDHGALGKTMCGNIPRVKDMRYWDDTPPGSTNDTNEVSMRGRRRNDTNTPRPGNTIATTFDHQSDMYPQHIAVRTFSRGYPHPLLSIRRSIRPSGIIDIMPDHPHEGECAPETSFTVNEVTIPSQIIATSFVNGGNISGTKDPTDPHCFPSIHVWDGRRARVGRIVTDSTWHHFVNINLNGVNTAQSGLTDADFGVIRQYYMNTVTWLSPRRSFFCWRPYLLFALMAEDQVIEATLNNPNQKMEEIAIADLNSIGGLAEEILADKHNPSFARLFMLDILEDKHPDFCELLDSWKPDGGQNTDGYHDDWVNLEFVLQTAIGAGFISLRDKTKLASGEVVEDDLLDLDNVFQQGVTFGVNKSLADLKDKYTALANKMGI